MRAVAVIFAFTLLISTGCVTTHSEHELYQSRIEGLGQEFLTIHLLDRNEPLKAHEIATMHLTFQLEDLKSLAKRADEYQIETTVDLAHLILKNAAEHREQLVRDKYSLQMVNDCANLVTNTQDLERAAELARYLAAYTNQVVYPKP